MSGRDGPPLLNGGDPTESVSGQEGFLGKDSKFRPDVLKLLQLPKVISMGLGPSSFHKAA